MQAELAPESLWHRRHASRSHGSVDFEAGASGHGAALVLLASVSCVAVMTSDSCSCCCMVARGRMILLSDCCDDSAAFGIKANPLVSSSVALLLSPPVSASVACARALLASGSAAAVAVCAAPALVPTPE